MAAGIVVAAMPAGVFAAQCGGLNKAMHEGAAVFGSAGAGQPLVLSGRVLGSDCAPLAGAVLEILQAGSAAVSATTDADGRFMVTTATPATRDGAPQLYYRVTHAAHDARLHTLHFTRGANGSAQSVAQVERDAAGVWRGAFGVTLA
jgi:protocatechuate 3,4-dioxygenase beta subunit